MKENLKKNELKFLTIIKENSENNVCTLTNKEFEKLTFSQKKVNRYLTKFTELKLIKLEYDIHNNRKITIINNMKEKTNNGIWLEAEIAGIENLDIPNVVLLQEIILLSKEKNCCFASNEHFAALLKINKSSASKRISQLVKLEYITTKNIFSEKNCIGRIIIPNFEKIKSASKIELPEVCEENNNPTAVLVKKIEDTIESTNTSEGILIQEEILVNKKLDSANKILLQEIVQLSKLKDGCFASNDHFSKLLNISKQAASKRIIQLVKLEYITTKNIFKNKNCLGRMITPNFEKIKSASKIELPEVCEEIDDSTTAAVKKIEDTIESTNTSEGILIQEEILVNKNLDWNNKPLLQEIINLSKEKNCCSESDEHFANLLHISRQATSKRINQLAELGYILVKKKIKEKYCVGRIITPNMKKISEEYNNENNIQSDSIKTISTEINEINKRREFLEKQYYYLLYGKN